PVEDRQRVFAHFGREDPGAELPEFWKDVPLPLRRHRAEARAVQVAELTASAESVLQGHDRAVRLDDQRVDDVGQPAILGWEVTGAGVQTIGGLAQPVPR